MKRNLRIKLLLSFVLIAGFNLETKAQGWTFTFQIAQTGPCAAYTPALVLPQLPSFGIPTQSQCESLRQTLLSVKQSYPVTDNRGNYIGDCSLFVTCTPCTGSDIVTPGQINPGDVSFDGQFQGKPFFTTHESSAFEDWSKDYRQQLESLGITSILGNTLSSSQLTLTGDKDFDAFYNNQTAKFNPTTPVRTENNLDASVVDLSGIKDKGVVQLLTTPEEQAKRDKWYEDSGFNDLTSITENEGISENKPAERSFLDASVRTALGEVPGVEGVFAAFGINLVDESFKNINQASSAFINGNDAKAVQSANDLIDGKSFYNAVGKTAKDKVSGDITDLAAGSVAGKVKGGTTLLTIAKIGYAFWENKHPND